MATREVERRAADAGAIRDLVPQLRGGRGGGDSRGDRAVGVDRVPDVHPGQCAKLRRVPRARPLQENVVAMFLDGKTFADATMVIALGITMTGRETLPGLRRNGHGERARC